jgi:acyl-CoA synthetase (AMP-forming)/AMP-acid ligase II
MGEVHAGVGTPWSTIGELVEDACGRHAEREALVDGDVRFTYADLGREIDRVARGLVAAGVGHGDRVAVWAPNCWEWPVTALAAHAVGAVLVPINTRFRGTEARDVLRRSGARVLCTVTDFLDTDYVELLDAAGGPLEEDLPALDHVVVLRGPLRPGTVSLADLAAGGDAVDDAELRRRRDAVGAGDLCHLMFTSGTTGAPKGVMLTHGATCRAYDTWADVVGLRPGDRYLVINPYFHSFGFNAGVLACLMRGATDIAQRTFDVDEVLATIAAEHITVLPGPPSIYQTLLNHPGLDAADLSSLRLAVTGAASIPVELIHRMRDVLGFDTVVTAYGLTEATGMATMCRPDDDAETIATTSGRAIDGVEVRVVGDDGVEVPRGEPGEIVLRGYNVMVGYLDDPAETARAVDPDGWLHTGDVGVMDDGGNIRITDRTKDMFIVGGFNAYPAEIENLLLGHPEIAQVAVIGVPDERLGEVGMAFVVPRAGTSPDPDGIVAWAREHMANYKAPRRVELVEALPLNATGKVVKDELRARAAGS